MWAVPVTGSELKLSSSCSDRNKPKHIIWKGIYSVRSCVQAHVIASFCAQVPILFLYNDVKKQTLGFCHLSIGPSRLIFLTLLPALKLVNHKDKSFFLNL